MRPPLLNPLFAPATGLAGVGPKIGRLIDSLLGRNEHPARVVDVLLHLPHSTLDWRDRPKLRDGQDGAMATIEVTVVEHRPPPPGRAKQPWRVLVEDETGDCQLVYFLANHDWIERMLPVGARRWVSGKLELWDGSWQMVHPDRVMTEADLARMPTVEPVYGLTKGLFPRVMAKAAASALDRLPPLPEWLDAALQRGRGWPGFDEAMRSLHTPASPEAVDPAGPAVSRLAYDELLAGQLALALVRADMRRLAGRASLGDGRIRTKIIAALPYQLTGAQVAANAEISADLASPERMLRMLQGDVGSGKTIVALIAMAQVVEAGRQAALMAPTEILARQHYERLAPLAEATGLKLALMTGRDKASERARTLVALADGSVDIAIGTHALFQEGVAFRDLALAIVDEQHRFGVHQRLALGAKGESVDILVMTATPIPRTLVLTFFGDMDVSSLREKPPGRLPVDTRVIALDRLDDVVSGLERALKTGARVYWVCPLVNESLELDEIAAATERFEQLQQRFGARVGLVHGQMKGRDKDAAMVDFQSGATQILVATTVVEVGVDVPEASVMVIEHAERFGLAQLHQLRGRVGRGMAKSSCLLLYKAPAGELARARLGIMRETEDGFRIAEEDLKLRGEGEVLGSRQSGQPGFRIARLEVHGPLLQVARDDAKLILATDPQLRKPRGEALRVLLYLFERDEAVRLLRAG